MSWGYSPQDEICSLIRRGGESRVFPVPHVRIQQENSNPGRGSLPKRTSTSSLILDLVSRSMRKVMSVVLHHSVYGILFFFVCFVFLFFFFPMGFWNSPLRRPSSKSWREKGMSSRPTRTSCNQHSNIPQSIFLPNCLASLVAQRVKNLPAMKEPQFLSLGQENTPKNWMTTHSSILA